jgi:hypothetical protein
MIGGPILFGAVTAVDGLLLDINFPLLE